MYARANCYFELPNSQWLEEYGVIWAVFQKHFITENVHADIYRHYVNLQAS